MNRRELLTTAGALALTACGPAASPPVPPQPAADPFSGARLMADVEAYVNFGIHRTGSPGDVATAGWFAEHWSKLGYAVTHQDVEAPNADTDVAKLRIGDEAFDGFAQPPLVFTPEGGLTAPLAWWTPDTPANVKGRIALIHVPREPGAVSPGAAYREASRRAAASGAVGVVMVMSGPSGEVVAINTPVDMTLGIPVLQIGEKEKGRLEAALATKAPGRLIMEGPGGTRIGRNTIARRGEQGPWVIISTPQSGWFTCGGERAPGIAMSRALAEWATTTNFPVRWLFVATSGHEWGDHGAHLFHDAEAPGPNDTALWFHLGASFGARAYEETPQGLVRKDTPNPIRTLMATPDLLPVCEKEFAGQVSIETPAPADLSKALGEYHLVLEEAYPSAAGFWGGNAHFHTPIDGIESTTPEIMEPIMRAVANVIEARLATL